MKFMHRCLTVVFLSFLAIYSSAGQAEVWKLASLEWPPYSGAQLEGQGKSVQLLRKVLTEHDIELQVDFFPWSRSQELAKTGRYIGYFPAWQEEVQPGFLYSPVIDWSSLGVISASETDFEWSGFEALFSQYSVGIIRSYKYPNAVE
ncbi:hypothetical protein [Litoribacillus peritrichatus]|uniref:Solute-binding protein family 3/N-terminal domain-containing protein n=1 Tax=Litoribacillus peritrichatus TaxID=718191 RepID=A0ABP7M910_9GAMM